MRTLLFMLIALAHVKTTMAEDIDTLSIVKKVKLLALCDYYNGSNLTLTIDRKEYAFLKSSGCDGYVFIKVKTRPIKILQKRIFFDELIPKDSDVTTQFNLETFEKLFVKKYKSKSFDNINTLENIIGYDRFIKNDISFSCDYVAAYNIKLHKIFKLKGFRNSDFVDFLYSSIEFDDYTVSPAVYNQIRALPRDSKEIWAKLSSLLKVDELDFTEMYNWYFEHNLPPPYAPCSCYARDNQTFH